MSVVSEILDLSHYLLDDPRIHVTSIDIFPRSYLQGQGHIAHMPKFNVLVITPYYEVGSW